MRELLESLKTFQKLHEAVLKVCDTYKKTDRQQFIVRKCKIAYALFIQS